MVDGTVFHTFRQHATFEVYSRFWHPLLPLLGRISGVWRKLAKEYWQKKLSAIERQDVMPLYWLPEKKSGIEIFYGSKTNVSFYRFLHSDDLQNYITIKHEFTIGLHAIATCFLYEWPTAAYLISKNYIFDETNVQVVSFAKICFQMAAAKRSQELVELACDIFHQERAVVAQVVGQMCAYNYKGMACFLCQRYSLTVEDLRLNDNSALYYAMKNDNLQIVQYLLRMFAYTADEVQSMLCKITTEKQYSFSRSNLGSETKQFVDEFLIQNIKK